MLFWLLTAIMADWVAVFDPYVQIRALKNEPPGAIDPESGLAFLFGGDALGRDVFSRMVYGSRTVMAIAPLATLFAYMIGITLGLPAGYIGGLVRHGAELPRQPGAGVPGDPALLPPGHARDPPDRDPGDHGGGLLHLSRWSSSRSSSGAASATGRRCSGSTSLPVILVGGFGYLGLTGIWDPTGLLRMQPNTLNIFLAVVFITSPTVFRIVRGLTLDIKTRDYVAAAQTRGERPWYIMMWEILPNARGPLIVDACLRIGYTTILLGTLGFFGLGVSPESPDWGSTINEGRKLLRIYVHPALPPALAIMSLVLGLNLLADALREQSMRD